MSHLNLSLSLAVRLANHKAGKDYKNRRDGVAYNGWDGEGASRERVAYFHGVNNSDWRFTGYADEVGQGIDHTGWFTDEFHDSKIRGVVYQMPARGGACRYVPGYELSDFGSVAIRITDVYDSKEDCARVADEIAEYQAEKEREYQEQEGARLRVEELREANVKLLADARELRGELRAVRACGHKVAARELKARIVTMLSEYRANVETIQKTESEHPELSEC